MAIVITGGNGFLGQELAKRLLTTDDLEFTELILVDIVDPTSPVADPRVKCLTFDLTDDNSIEELFKFNIDVIFHLAAVVSGAAERDISLGHKVNVETTHKLLEAIRHKDRPQTKLVFTSSRAVYGRPELFNGELSELSALFPQSSYGFQKAICELLINDYTRKGFVDGRVGRLPTIAIRSGAANAAVTSFISNIIREPLNGQSTVCPVTEDTKVWISSPQTLVKNLIQAAKVPAHRFGPHRNVNLPGISVSMKQMLDSLREVAGPERAQLVRFEYNQSLQTLMTSIPPSFNIDRALDLGFFRDQDFNEVLHNYIQSEGLDVSDSSTSSSSSDEN